MATIAVLDDVPANRELLAVVLRALGHRVVEAENGAAGLALVRRERPALVLCDILMPEVDGYEFVRRLRADPLIAHTPVVFCTAHYLEAEARDLAAACGVADMLLKPCEPEEIIRAVQNVLEAPGGAPLPSAADEPDFDRRHLKLITAKLSDKVSELERANEKLQALADLNLRHARALEKEIVERELAQRHLAAQYAVARVLDEADALGASSPRLLETICTMLRFAAGTLWRVDEEGLSLRCTEAWCAPDAPDSPFITATRRLVLQRNAAIPGKVWASGKAVWMPSLEDEPDFVRREAAQRTGLRSGGAFPIVAGGRVAGIFDVFSTESRPEDQRLVQTLATIGKQIGQFFEREAQRTRVLRLTRLYAVLSGINSAIVRLHHRGDLFREACRIAIEEGEFRIAWIGEVDAAAGDLRPTAWAGATDAQDLAQRLAGIPFVAVRRAIADAVRSSTPVTCNDLSVPAALDPPVQPVPPDCRSFIALPIGWDGKVAAVMGLHAREPGFFIGEELDLLKELATDISFALEYIAKQDLLAYLAYHDVLTGLPNRTHLQESLTHALQAARRHPGERVGVVLWNVNRFRGINDTFGRHAGDAVLRELARRFDTTWPEKTHVMRVGVDHFAAVATGLTEITDIAHLVERTAHAVCAEPVMLDGRELRVSLSAGIAVFEGANEDAEALLKNAEAALRQAKRAGSRYLFYGPEMNAMVAETLMLENKLRQAAEREEFELYYQPKVDCATRRVTGLEALIRWNDPEDGLVSPGRFVPILEETGMIIPVGLWVIRRALADAQAWRAAGIEPPRIAVNVSPIQLQQPDFVESVKSCLKGHDGQASLIDFEITESMVMADVEENIGRLSEVRGFGVDIAIDDFGTGYSSLGYLGRLPVSALKIDRSFIAAMTRAADNMNIVSTIISLAHSLQLKVIAEGVEAEEQARFLRRFRCNELQGYLISQPVPAARAARFAHGKPITAPLRSFAMFRRRR